MENSYTTTDVTLTQPKPILAGGQSAQSIVKSGDNVKVQLTVTNAYQQNFIDSQITIIAGQKLNAPIYCIDGLNGIKWALFRGEYDAISSEIIGMKTGEEKAIQEPTTGIGFSQSWSAEMVKRNGADISNINFGDNIPISISDGSEISKRIGTITGKSSDGINIDFSYPNMKIKIIHISQYKNPN